MQNNVTCLKSYKKVKESNLSENRPTLKVYPVKSGTYSAYYYDLVTGDYLRSYSVASSLADASKLIESRIKCNDYDRLSDLRSTTFTDRTQMVKIVIKQ